MIIAFLLWFPHFLYVPILSPYMENNGVPYSFAGIVLGSYGVMQLLLRVPIGIGSDILKNKKLFIISGMFISFLSCCLFIFADNEWWLLLARTLAGAGAASWVTFTIFYTNFFDSDKVPQAMGSISFIIVLAQFISMGISGGIVSTFGWEAPFYISGSVSFIGLVLAFFIFEEDDKNKQEPMNLKDVPSILKDPDLLKAAFLSVLAHSIMFATIFGFMPTYALSLGFDASDLIYVIIAFMVPHGIATLIVGNHMVPVLGVKSTLLISFVIVSIFVLLTPLTSNEIVFLICQAFTGFGLGIIFPVLLSLPIQNITYEKRTTAMGIYQSLYALGIFAGPYLAGIFNSAFGLSSGFYFLSFLGIIGVLLISYWGRGKENLI